MAARLPRSRSASRINVGAAPSQTQLIRTKIAVPRARAGVVLRPRLVKRLWQAVERPFTLASAPAGFGKTTLLATAVQSPRRDVRVAWLSLDQEDSDPARFFQYLIFALQSVVPNLGAARVSLFSGLQMPAPRDIMETLLYDIADIPTRILLVLDDYHVISNPSIDAALVLLVERAPEQLRLLISTREEPDFPLARWRSREIASEIRAEDLRFSSAETGQFLRDAMGLDIDANSTRAFETRTEGWVAGLQMAALSLQGESVESAQDAIAQRVSEFSGGHRLVIDYLAAEVLRRQPDDVRAFLEQTSILDRLSASLCDAVTERSNSGRLLARLERANMFILRLDEHKRWYRYHQLFLDFLRSGLDERKQRALHARASAWFEQNGFGEEAMKHARAAQDVAATVRLFRALADEALSHGEISKLLSWLEALPDETVRTHSDLAGYMAWMLYLRGKTRDAQEYARLAKEPGNSAATSAHRGMLSTIHSFIALNWGDSNEAMGLARKGLKQLGKSKSFFRTYALSLLGQAQRVAGDRQTALETFQQVVRLGSKLGNDLMAIDALGHLVPLMYWKGELREAILLCRQWAARYSGARGNPVPVSGLLYVMQGVLDYEINDLESARMRLLSGIELTRQVGMVAHTLNGLRSLAKLQYLSGERERAWESLAEARLISEQPESRLRKRLVAITTAELHLWEGNIQAAARMVEESSRSFAAPLEQESFAQARVLLAEHQPRRALNLLLRLEMLAKKDGFEGSLIAIHILQALCHEAMAGRVNAVASMEKAVSLAAPAGYCRLFLDEGRAIVNILEPARHAAPDFVNSVLLLLSNGGLQDSTSRALPEPLRKSELEILRLLKRGLTNQEIAAELELTIATIKWHLGNIFGKLHVRNRTGAVTRARELKLL